MAAPSTAYVTSVSTKKLGRRSNAYARWRDSIPGTFSITLATRNIMPWHYIAGFFLIRYI